MDLHQIEYAAIMFFRFCEQHPDLCPHDWNWSWSRQQDKDNQIKAIGYHCGLCGSNKAIEITRREGESDYEWERRID